VGDHQGLEVALHLQHVLVAVLGQHLRGPADDAGDVLGQGGIQASHRGQLEGRLGLGGVSSGQGLVECHAQGVDIRAGVGLAAVLLGGGIPRRADPHRVALLVRVEVSGDAEVDQLDLGAHQHDVAGFDVPEDDGVGLLAVQVVQDRRDLGPPLGHLALGQRTADPGQHASQVLALHVLHDQVVATVELEVVGHRGQAGVFEPGQQSGLALEVSQGRRLLLGVGIARRHLLDRVRRTTQAGVLADVDVAHPALAQQTLDAVAVADQRSRRQHVWPSSPNPRLMVAGTTGR